MGTLACELISNQFIVAPSLSEHVNAVSLAVALVLLRHHVNDLCLAFLSWIWNFFLGLGMHRTNLDCQSHCCFQNCCSRSLLPSRVSCQLVPQSHVICTKIQEIIFILLLFLKPLFAHSSSWQFTFWTASSSGFPSWKASASSGPPLSTCQADPSGPAVCQTSNLSAEPHKTTLIMPSLSRNGVGLCRERCPTKRDHRFDLQASLANSWKDLNAASRFPVLSQLWPAARIHLLTWTQALIGFCAFWHQNCKTRLTRLQSDVFPFVTVPTSSRIDIWQQKLQTDVRTEPKQLQLSSRIFQMLAAMCIQGQKEVAMWCQEHIASEQGSSWGCWAILQARVQCKIRRNTCTAPTNVC